MKSSYINGILLAAFLLFAIVYWNIRSATLPQESIASSAAATNGATMGSLPPNHPTTGSPQITIDALKERVENAPTDTTLLNHLAQVLHDESRYEEAAVYYEKYLALAPRNIQGWLDLANVYAALQKWEQALEASQSLLAFAPQHPSAMYNMGAIYANLTNIEQAVHWWTQVKDQQEDPDLALQASLNLQQIQPSASQ